MVRRRRSNSVGVLTAVLVELGTILAIVALAQPTWTRRWVEGMGRPAESAQAVPAERAAPLETPAVRAGGIMLGTDVPHWGQPARLGGWQAVAEAERHDPARIASVPDWSAVRQSSQMTPLAPVYPPSRVDPALAPWNPRY
ncbi:MAG: hypothetical protein KDA45_05700 [Planctomycetales bacterium]|nr:hypothetical protein [Planctomycetales bacterium]